MKKLIQALIHSIPDFANVGTFLVYVFILFATIGLHQYSGVMYNMCRFDTQPENQTTWLVDTSIQRVCTQTNLGNYYCPSPEYCGNNDEYPQINIAQDNIINLNYINYGITNFDNLGTSLLSVFQIINSDTWYQQLINVQDVDIPIYGTIYCVLMIVIGQFFLMNLILAVIIFSFIKTQKHELEGEINALDVDTKQDTEGISASPDVSNIGNSQRLDRNDFEIIKEEPEHLEEEEEGSISNFPSRASGLFVPGNALIMFNYTYREEDLSRRQNTEGREQLQLNAFTARQ